MTPEALFHELLGLGVQWRVRRCEFEAEEGLVRLWIEETPRLWEAESIAAGEAVSCYDHVEEVVWRHLNVFEHRCEIRCRLPRGRRVCDAEGKVYRVTPPWEGLAKHFTKGFEAMVLLLLRQMPVAAVARHVGETDTRLWRLLQAHVARAWPRVDLSGVVCVGCDELSARKGHCYVSVFCDLIGKRVLFAVAGKDKTTWEAFVTAVGEHNGHPRAITEVSIDMSPAYIAGVKENLGDHLQPLFAAMVKTAGMIERHLEGVMAHWIRRTTNAFLEGLNSVFSAVKRKARGFRSTENLITMLYFTAGRLDIPATH